MKQASMHKRVLITNSVGTLGYAFTLASWTLLIAVLFVILLPDTNTTPVVQPPISSEISPTQTTEDQIGLKVFGYAMAAIAIGFVLYLFVTLPYHIGKNGSRLMRLLLRYAGIASTRRQLFLVKAVVATVPILCFMVLFVIFKFDSITFAALHIMAIAMTIFALMSFLVQLLIAKRFKVMFKQMW